MRALVKREFVDKYTKVLHSEGSTFECTEDRFNEIKEAGDFIEEVKEPVNSTKAEKVEKPKTEKPKTERTVKNGNSNRK